MKTENKDNIYKLVNLREEIRNKLKNHKEEINNSQCDKKDFKFIGGNSNGYSTLECYFFFSMKRGYYGSSSVSQCNPKIPQEEFNKLVISYLNKNKDDFWEFVDKTYTDKIKLAKNQLVKDIKEKEELLKSIEEEENE